MNRLEQNEHEIHALREEIRTRLHGGPTEGMRPDSHVIGELQRKLESLKNKYQLLKHAGTPPVNPAARSEVHCERRALRCAGGQSPAWNAGRAGLSPGGDWVSMTSCRRRHPKGRRRNGNCRRCPGEGVRRRRRGRGGVASGQPSRCKRQSSRHQRRGGCSGSTMRRADRRPRE